MSVPNTLSELPVMRLPVVTDRQLAAILAGLRLYQALQASGPTAITAEVINDVADIGTDGGSLKALTAEQIDVLCERLNRG